MSRIAEAAKLPSCPWCGANRGDPCRAPSNQVVKPHKSRVEKAIAIDGWSPDSGL